MADTSASHLIWFITAVVVATILSGVMVDISLDLANRVERRGRLTSAELSYDISIENDVTMVPYNNTTNNVMIYIKNTGSREIYYSGVNYTFVLLITGGNLTNTHFLPINQSVLGARPEPELLPGRTMVLTYNVTALYPDYQYHIKIIATEYSNVGDSTYIRIVYV